jgi:hypothetical protein
MNELLKKRVREYLYPFNPNSPNEWKFAFIVLVVFAVLSFCVRIYGKWNINGIPVKGYVIWVLLNVYLLGGVVWELLLDPKGEKTVAMSRGRRIGLICMAILAVAISLIVVWIKK